MLQGESEAALVHAQRAVDLLPGDSDRQLALARVLDRVEQRDDARAAAEKALRLADDEAQREAAIAFLGSLAEVVSVSDS